MNKQQQKLYDKLLKKVNEYCLGAAAEDVIAAIDSLVDTYESKTTEADGYATQYAEALRILKKHLEPKTFQVRKPYLGITVGQFHASYEIDIYEYSVLREILK